MLAVEVSDASQVAAARRCASGIAASSGFDVERAGQVALAASELSTNLLKHGGGGQLLVNADDNRLELLALDRGKGIADLTACLADGYSTVGTLGAGLGAVKRLAQEFGVAAWPGLGTAVLAIISRDASPLDTSPAPCGLVVAKTGEEVAGDAWSSHRDASGITVFVVDGLGHGIEAARAANEAVTQFQHSRQEPPAEIIASVHRAMRHTRGGAVAVARLQWESATVTYAGLGNITGVVVSPASPARRMVSHAGIAGHNARKIQAFEYPCPDGLLIMHSDGVGTRWTLSRYPELIRMHPLLVAGVLYRDFARGSDDATIAVSRTACP
jgi:anti-sigma regulatory factor (Ser/Thr protein kinase)